MAGQGQTYVHGAWHSRYESRLTQENLPCRWIFAFSFFSTITSEFLCPRKGKLASVNSEIERSVGESYLSYFCSGRRKDFPMLDDCFIGSKGTCRSVTTNDWPYRDF